MEKNPVIRLDLSNGKYYEKERVHGTIGGILRDHEKRWNVTVYDEYNYDDRLKNIIHAAYEQTGEQVVILIDEYAVRFAADTRPVWAVGMNISQDRRTIDSYHIVQV